MQFTKVTQSQTELLARLRIISRCLCAGIVLTAMLTLAGWQFDWEFFKRPIPGLVAMHPLTAICFISACISLVAYSTTLNKRLVQFAALLPLLVGLLMLIKRITGWGPNLQTLLFAEKLKADVVGNLSNLMAPNTAFCFLLAGASLIYLHTDRKANRSLVQWLALLVGVVTLVTLLGYAYRVQVFYGALVSYPMAIHTALCFLLLALSILLTTASQGFMWEIFSRWLSGLPGLSLIGVALIVPFLLGFWALSGYWSTVFSPELAVALFVASLTLILLALIWRNIRVLNQKEEQQRQIQDSLRQQEGQIQTLFRAAPDAILVFDQQGTLVTWNMRATQLLGVGESNNLTNRSVGSFIAEQSQAVFQQEWQMLTTGENPLSTYNFELTALKHDQTEFEASFSISHTLVQDKLLFISFIRDVTSQREATRQLKQANSDLIRSNESLQQFAYIASHDMQEPLRKIQSFADLLKSQYSDQLGEGVSFLERMQASAGRMSILIRDLLALARISTYQDTTTQISLTEVIDTVLADLEIRLQETQAIVEVGPLPTLAGDGLQLGQLFLNLVSNALKFQRIGTAPLVRVSSNQLSASHLPTSITPGRAASTYHCISVSDNGIGFDEKHTERIFQIFQRLHGKNEFAGTGIGLAICQKVVTNHGGIIMASSQPGEGATFCVYLPA